MAISDQTLTGGKVKLILLVLSIFIGAAFFFIGRYVGERNILNNEKFKLKEEILLSHKGAQGYLPAGSTLYKFRELPEISTYVVFVNLKEKNVLEPYSSEKKLLLSPINGYVE